MGASPEAGARAEMGQRRLVTTGALAGSAGSGLRAEGSTGYPSLIHWAPATQVPSCSFHNFNTLFRHDDSQECVGFTAAQVGRHSRHATRAALPWRRSPGWPPLAQGCRSFSIHVGVRHLPAVDPQYRGAAIPP